MVVVSVLGITRPTVGMALEVGELDNRSYNPFKTENLVGVKSKCIISELSEVCKIAKCSSGIIND